MDKTIFKELINLVNQGYRWEVLNKASYIDSLRKRHESILACDAETIFVRFINSNHIFPENTILPIPTVNQMEALEKLVKLTNGEFARRMEAHTMTVEDADAWIQLGLFHDVYFEYNSPCSSLSSDTMDTVE